MVKTWCKNDWESTVYKIKYGKIQLTLKTITINLDPKTFCSEIVGKGSYGQIFKFELTDKKIYALKNIKINN